MIVSGSRDSAKEFPLMSSTSTRKTAAPSRPTTKPNNPEPISQKHLGVCQALEAHRKAMLDNVREMLAGGSPVEPGEFILDLKALDLALRPIVVRKGGKKS
jgi:hypothetical protein